jgi:hypothetical protein
MKQLGLCTIRPKGMFLFTLVLSQFLKIKKRRWQSQLARQSRHSLPLVHRSPSPATTTSASSILGPSLASVTLGCVAGIAPVDRPCPQRWRWRHCPPHHLLLWLETARASWPCRTSCSHRGSARPDVPSERSSRQPSLWCSSLHHLPSSICPSRRLSSSLTFLPWWPPRNLWRALLRVHGARKARSLAGLKEASRLKDRSPRLRQCRTEYC